MTHSNDAWTNPQSHSETKFWRKGATGQLHRMLLRTNFKLTFPLAPRGHICDAESRYTDEYERIVQLWFSFENE